MITAGYYKPLFFLQLAHSAHALANKTLFELEPTAPCREVMTNLALVFYQNAQGFSVAAQVKNDTEPWQLLKPLTREQLTLSFVLFSANQHFYPDSFLPFDPPGQFVYCFDNLDGSTARTRSLTETDGITVALRLPMVSGGIVAERSSTPPQLSDANGQLVPLTTRLTHSDGQYRIDLAGLVAGRYCLSDDRGSQDYYVCSAAFARRAPIAVIEVYLHRQVDNDYQIIEYRQPWQPDTMTADIGQFISPKQWALHFGRFCYFWRYRIKTSERLAAAAQVIQIQSSDEHCVFEPGFMVIDPTTKDIVFTGTRSVSLTEDWPLLQLYLYKLGTGSDEFEDIGSEGSLYCQLLGRLPLPSQPKVTFVEEQGKLIGEMHHTLEPMDDFGHQQPVDIGQKQQIWAALEALRDGGEYDKNPRGER
ncbi:MAG: hypothetical protein ACI8WB_001027 [Phenylobacterium sp.]|jgi:hypothetical protein